jgi:hypothetical protein
MSHWQKKNGSEVSMCDSIRIVVWVNCLITVLSYRWLDQKPWFQPKEELLMREWDTLCFVLFTGLSTLWQEWARTQRGEEIDVFFLCPDFRSSGLGRPTPPVFDINERTAHCIRSANKSWAWEKVNRDKPAWNLTRLQWWFVKCWRFNSSQFWI